MQSKLLHSLWMMTLTGVLLHQQAHDAAEAAADVCLDDSLEAGSGGVQPAHALTAASPPGDMQTDMPDTEHTATHCEPAAVQGKPAVRKQTNKHDTQHAESGQKHVSAVDNVVSKNVQTDKHDVEQAEPEQDHHQTPPLARTKIRKVGVDVTGPHSCVRMTTHSTTTRQENPAHQHGSVQQAADTVGERCLSDLQSALAADGAEQSSALDEEYEPGMPCTDEDLAAAMHSSRDPVPSTLPSTQKPVISPHDETGSISHAAPHSSHQPTVSEHADIDRVQTDEPQEQGAELESQQPVTLQNGHTAHEQSSGSSQAQGAVHDAVVRFLRGHLGPLYKAQVISREVCAEITVPDRVL